ncbi:MAG TPA: glutathione S-transferase family protein [Polyangiaceae bacterium]|nr:glutathione S-transferase family protein [Polyangiaceae bacterium]
MAIEIFWGSGSPFSWRVLLALQIKNVPYESKLLEFSKGEHQASEYLKINPRGKVPALRDGDYTLYESLAMLQYIEKKHPSPALFGTTAAETGKIMQAVCECENYFMPPVEAFTLPIYFGQLNDSNRSAVIEAGYNALLELSSLEQHYERGDYLLGDTVTAVDLCYYPLLQGLLRAAGKPTATSLNLDVLPLEKRFPRLAAWCRRIEALPGYDKTYPPHWRS